MRPRRHLRRWVPLLLALGLLATTTVARNGLDERPPNILLIIADDQGWNGTSVQMDPNLPESRSDYYQTPNLERLAARGMRFSQAYSAAPICSPTRAALQTGLSPAQLQLTDVRVLVGDKRFWRSYANRPLSPPLPRNGLPFNRVTLAERLRTADGGYRSAFFGKWHLGEGARDHALAHGFDVAGGGRIDWEADPKGIDKFGTAAVEFAAECAAAEQPFFIQLAHLAPHLPVAARSETIERWRARPPGVRHTDPEYAAMTEELDAGVGFVLDRLEELGVAENTYVIYYSDNGPSVYFSKSNPLWRGKSSLWEGGIRVPLIIAGPGIESNSVCDVPVTTVDLTETICAIARVPGPPPPGIEGTSLLPLLRGGGRLPGGAPLNRRFAPSGELFFHSPHYMDPFTPPMSAVRHGDLKFVRVLSDPPVRLLFDLAEFVGERPDPDSPWNLADDYPAIADALEAKLDAWLDAVDAPRVFEPTASTTFTWDAGALGNEPGLWRSLERVGQLVRETWRPAQEGIAPGLAPMSEDGRVIPAVAFDGRAGFARRFFQVGPVLDGGSSATGDTDHSITIQLLARFDDLEREQVVFETGDGRAGLSLTLGDGDDDGRFDDLRFRVLDRNCRGWTVTADLPPPVSDDGFRHIAAVVDDSATSRELRLYADGSLLGRTEVGDGPGEYLDWGSWDDAGLGIAAGEGLGGAGGSGALPFGMGGDAGWRGALAGISVSNRALAEYELTIRWPR